MEESAGKYIYCIIRSEVPQEFTILGVGERGDVVHTVHYENLAAVVSNSPQSKYEQTRRNMMAHTRVLEEVMEKRTILPVRFGTVAPGREAIRDKILRRKYGEFERLLRDMDGHVEVGLKTFWYEDIVFEEIIAENSSIRELRDRLLGKPIEQTYRDRIRLGEMVERAMQEKRERDSGQLLSALKPLAEDMREKEAITDRMVLNAAFLIDGSSQEEFDRTIQELDAEMGDRMMFKYIGPVPPYNFVSIVVSWE